MDERQAVARLQRGDIGGLETLVRLYQVRATRAAYLITRDRELAADIMQATFLKAYERIQQFDPTRPFGPWFLRSVVNDAIKASVRHSCQVSLDAAGDDADGAPPASARLADGGPGPDALWEQAETAAEVWDALARLSPTQRAAIVQRYFLELNEAEMSAAMHRPPSTVKWRLHAGRERLRALLRSTPQDSEAL
jgi:RNA polymerase sigma-70 factor, ECF subfamily